MPRKVKCPDCLGYGEKQFPQIPINAKWVCITCGGTGWKRKPKKENHEK